MINFLLLVTGVYIFIKAMQELQFLIQSLPFSFSGLRKGKEDTGVEINEIIPEGFKYDVSAFRQRIQVLRDEDGLYDVVEKTPVTDFTGTEIITADAEMDIEKYTRR